ncbi:unnamed protein product, partial [Symbiodinium necroappetens]
MRTTNSVDTEDEYQWWTKKRMLEELGPELTEDLVARHLKEDPKASGRFIKQHPDFPHREDLYRYKNYAATSERHGKRQETSAEVAMEAELQESEAFEA